MVKKSEKSKKKKEINLEIERKFLLKRFPKKVLEKYKKNIERLHIIQYYFLIDKVWQRFREVKADGKKTKYIHTIKKSLSPGVYEENEKAISEKKFFDTKKEHLNSYAVIQKTRWVIKFKGLKFEIDVYQDLSLVVLEVELPELKHHFEFPEGLFEEIIYEVTGIKQFSNFSLALKVKK